MISFDFNTIADFVVLKFTCPECGEFNETDALSVPTPDFTAETHHDSCNSEDYEHICPKCGHLFDITLNNGFYGGDGEISDLGEDNSLSVKEEFPDNDYEEDLKSMFFDEHVIETIDVLDRIDCLDEPSRKLLYRTLYANIISSMEAYLSDKIISRVLSTTESKRKFVENYKGYNELKLSLSDIYKKMDNIDSCIIKTLRNIIYHNLPVVKNIYKTALGVEIGDISELMKYVAIRHDIVHRNGKDKEGVLHNITKEDVITLATKISDFIRNIESEFSKLNSDNGIISPEDIVAELPFI